jgi:hypothetical protein
MSRMASQGSPVRTRIALILMLASAFASPSHAAPPPSCSGSAPTIAGSVYSPSITLGGVCRVTFTVAATGPVTMTLQPGAQFTGTLQAAVRAPGVGFSVKGIFADGSLVYGAATKTVTLSAGDWQLEILAGGSPPCLPNPPPPGTIPQCPTSTGYAVGPFSGSAS